jgi:MinD-like ATPase involved in chromosome partitioning or flagellar assembly
MSRLIAFWSPAGAGATTLVLNTAAALAARRLSAAAIDLNLPRPGLALAADLLPHDQPRAACLSRLLPLLEGGRLTPDDLLARMLSGPGFALLPGFLDVVAASRVTEGYVRRMLTLLHGRYDVLLADLTPALDSVACLPVLQVADRIVVVAAPDIASRFHTRRHLLPVKGLGLDSRMLGVLNRDRKADRSQVSADIDLPVAHTIPDLRWMGHFADAGQIAYLAQPVLPPLARFRTAIDGLAMLVTQEG